MATTKSSRAARSRSAGVRKPRSAAPAPAAARKPSRSSRSNAELDAVYDTFLQQPAQLTLQQMNMIERRLCTGDTQWRQLALASLTKSGTELKERFASTRSAAQLAAELLTVADDMGKRMHQLADMLETASTRLMLSLCERPDMHELIDTARARMHHGAPPDEASAGEASDADQIASAAVSAASASSSGAES